MKHTYDIITKNGEWFRYAIHDNVGKVVANCPRLYKSRAEACTFAECHIRKLNKDEREAHHV